MPVTALRETGSTGSTGSLGSAGVVVITQIVFYLCNPSSSNLTRFSFHLQLGYLKRAWDDLNRSEENGNEFTAHVKRK